jgi:hypothetical protein
MTRSPSEADNGEQVRGEMPHVVPSAEAGTADPTLARGGRGGRGVWRCACLASLLFWPAMMAGLATGPMVGGEAPFTPLGALLFVAFAGFMLATLVHAIRNAQKVGRGWLLMLFLCPPITCYFYYVIEIELGPDAPRDRTSGDRAS